MSFWESHFLWLEAVIAACAVGAACAVVGAYMILRRVVFLPAALAQVSGLGVVLAFALPGVLSCAQGAAWASPEVIAGAVTLVASVSFGWMRTSRTLGRDAIIGIAYLLASALVVVIADGLAAEGHSISDILFGNAVVVGTGQMFVAVIVAAVVLAMHAVFMRPFLFVSFAPQTATAHGVPVRLLDTLLFVTVGVTIAVATKTIGAMPVFAFAVIPAAAALQAFSDMRWVLMCAAAIGAASAFLGYWLSFVAAVPTGPSMALVTVLFFVPTAAIGRAVQKRSLSKACPHCGCQGP